MGIVHSLWVSKLRYGLQLCTKVRTSESEISGGNMKALQITQNKLLRVLNGTRIKDKISIRSMLTKFELLSVNQLAAKIKLIEVWKTINRANYPLILESYSQSEILPSHDLRAQSNRIYNDTCRLRKSESSFHKDAARLWNLAPMNIHNAHSLEMAMKAIDKYCNSLPV